MDIFAFRRHFPVSVDCKRISRRKTTKLRLARNGGKTPKETSPQPAHPQYLHSIIHEELPKVNDDFRKGTRRGDRRPQGKENGGFIDAIKKLDKHTLNMYTALRAGLGTRELSWIRLDFRDLQANGNAKRFQEECRQYSRLFEFTSQPQTPLSP